MYGSSLRVVKERTIGTDITTTQSKLLDADLQEIKILAEDLVTQARKAGHTITAKLQPETD